MAVLVTLHRSEGLNECVCVCRILGCFSELILSQDLNSIWCLDLLTLQMFWW